MSGRRGVAMLLVLMTITVLIAGVSVIADARTSEHFAMRHAMDVVLVDDMLSAADAAIRTWLDEESDAVVLPPETRAPWVCVLDDRMDVDGRNVRVRIGAWDQQGMWPANSDDLGLELPAELTLDERPTVGLETARVFPSVRHPTARAGLLATHNPWPTRSGTTRSRAGAVVNMNTAPTDLLEAVYAGFPAGDLGEVVRLRGAGEMAVVPAGAHDAQQRSVRLVSISRVWSFRVDAEVGPLKRSWWGIYANRGGNWMLVQRIVIGHD